VPVEIYPPSLCDKYFHTYHQIAVPPNRLSQTLFPASVNMDNPEIETAPNCFSVLSPLIPPEVYPPSTTPSLPSEQAE
jgi:hypothetical protein